MKNCTSGFYCPQGTNKPTLPCPAGYFCPTGLGSLDEVYNYPCPAGFYCAEQTVISDDVFENCKNDISSCSVGKKCPMNKFCPVGTTDKNFQSCPNGTISNPGTTKVADCERNMNVKSKIYATIDILNSSTTSGFHYISLQPLQYAYFI